LAACGGAADPAAGQPVAAGEGASLQGLLPTPTPEVPLVSTSYAGAAVDAVPDSSLEGRLMDLYRQANQAVVYIIAAPLGTGSGFVYDADGRIVTNNHVVDGARAFEIVFANGERRVGQLIGTDVDSDLAVLEVDDLPAGVTPLPLAAPDDIAVGQFVAAIGNPFGEQGSMSLGIVSGLGRSLPSQRPENSGSSYTLPAVIQTDAPINPGNSGGPLLNLNGQVVGVNAAIASATGANSGVGFSIPVAALHRIVPSLIAEGRYVYPYLGAGFDEEVSLAEQAAYGLPQTFGTYVVSITPGGPADAAGLVAADPNTGRGGDLIVAIDGQAVGDFQDLNRYLVLQAEAGQTIEVAVLRGGNALSLPLTLGRRP
jgi:2-alkenal reductase